MNRQCMVTVAILKASFLSNHNEMFSYHYRLTIWSTALYSLLDKYSCRCRQYWNNIIGNTIEYMASQYLITYDKRTNQSINASQMTIWQHDTHAFTSVERSSTRLLWNATKATSIAQRKNCELIWLILQIYSAKIAQMFITFHKPLSNTITNDNALVIRKYFMSS